MDYFADWYVLAGLNEACASKKTDLEKFAAKRREGAELIASQAKSKGGPSKLTATHFEAKLPIYRKAADGHFEARDAKADYMRLLSKLASLPTSQDEFQKLTGQMEALGELLIGPKNVNLG